MSMRESFDTPQIGPESRPNTRVEKLHNGTYEIFINGESFGIHQDAVRAQSALTGLLSSGALSFESFSRLDAELHSGELFPETIPKGAGSKLEGNQE